jgi:WS/DGAT/MGAT family acyltransferase
MHIGSFAVYDQSSAPGGRVTFTGILRNVESRLHLADCFRQKLVTVPFDIDHPYWIEDENFNIEFHVRHIALPQPGDWRQLCIQVARIHARPMDLSRPLWEMYVIEGLDNVEDLPKGSFALVTKIHHTAIDGVSGAQLAAAIHDLEPDGAPAAPENAWIPERSPNFFELSARTLANNIRQPFRFLRVLAKTAPALAGALRSSPVDPEEIPSAPVPRTRFNGTVSAHRVVEGRSFDLSEVRDIRKRVDGATVNDVILTICAGALRRYLQHHGELPDESLVAMAPISVRPADQLQTAGNQISAMFVTLCTNIADPLERLEAVHDGTQNSKATAEAVGARTMTDITQVLPGTLSGLAARLYTRFGLANRIKPFLNTIITNVPGPQIPLYFTGARMVALHGMGPIMEGVGIIHPVFSCSGKISVAVTCCRDMMPDPEFYADCLQASYDDLKISAQRAGDRRD